ncbi:MAG: molybdate ABC transporter substrate-binding protein [Deltaproteobacteria bacterium]|nr:molybdate ABC transporter substrate-binding protein [Deltaproteobacteria bacterium]
MKRLASILLCCVLALGLASPRIAAAEDLVVFAAASLTDVLKEMGRAWEARTKDTVTFNFAASSDLARQIKAGAPADVFFSADVARMEEVEREGLVDRTERREVLSNVLVVVVPKGATTEVKTASDLEKLTRIALADPESVPAGVYAKKYLASQGLWSAIADKIIPTTDVRAALAAVEGEHVDAGIVYRTDAATSKGVRVAFEVAREQGPPIVYALAPLKASSKARARTFVRFLESSEARPIYERFGFLMLAPK